MDPHPLPLRPPVTWYFPVPLAIVLGPVTKEKWYMPPPLCNPILSTSPFFQLNVADQDSLERQLKKAEPLAAWVPAWPYGSESSTPLLVRICPKKVYTSIVLSCWDSIVFLWYWLALPKSNTLSFPQFPSPTSQNSWAFSEKEVWVGKSHLSRQCLWHSSAGGSRQCLVSKENSLVYSRACLSFVLTDMELLCLLSPIFLYLGVDVYFSVDIQELCFFYCVRFIKDSYAFLSGCKREWRRYRILSESHMDQENIGRVSRMVDQYW